MMKAMMWRLLGHVERIAALYSDACQTGWLVAQRLDHND